VLDRKKQVSDADHARNFFLELKRDNGMDASRPLNKNVSLPQIDFPKTIFSESELKRKKSKKTNSQSQIISDKKLTSLLKNHSEMLNKKIYFKNGKLHTVEQETFQRPTHQKETNQVDLDSN
jgi:hypothetical protein